MDSDERFLRPCKQLPSPTSDRYNSQMSIGQHIGTQSLNQGLVDNRSRESLQEPSTGPEDTDDEIYQSDQDFAVAAPEQRITEERMAKHLKGKEKDWTAIANKAGPLRLLDLPLDILKIILKNVTHTNDLANCAKVNSILHALTTPTIYSRFDIVWPDTLNSAEPRVGVDALTYGLATLVMREDLFGNVTYPSNASCGVSCQSYECPHCRSVSYMGSHRASSPLSRKSRRGNYFSEFVKKFSLGNGPPEWVQEYLVTKEGGKMLGTLVALSIARMPNLESFVWDMPTGVLRDIWIALASLGDYRPSKLAKLWIRFHDNQAALHDAGLVTPNRSANGSHATPASAPQAIPPPSECPRLMEPRHYGVNKIVWTDHRVEQPNFSTMPPLRSLTVLDIDEARYLIELSVLLGRSLASLRELRIGMAPTLYIPPCIQIDPKAAALFTGGIFTLLMCNICDQYSSPNNVGIQSGDGTHGKASTDLSPQMSSNIHVPTSCSNVQINDTGNFASTSPDTDATAAISSPVVGMDAIDPALFGQSPAPKDGQTLSQADIAATARQNAVKDQGNGERDDSNGINCEAASSDDVHATIEKLKLEVLELERLTRLVSRVLCRSIDFTVLTNLTLLQCGDQSVLWDRLKTEFAPRKSLVISLPTREPKTVAPQSRLRRKPSSDSLAKRVEYQLNLKRIHTDAVSSNLISFLKTTLAPNSLEWMFLQDTATFISPVTLEAIYRGPLRHHRASLAKVMIDSAYGPMAGRARIQSARKWTFSRDVVAFITSGKMSKLRELSMAMEYKDWHFFLQRLPNIPHLRSLHVPNILEHPYGSSLVIKDLARGVVDTVALRPEVELCYLAIKNKCFEILERKRKKRPKGQPPTGLDDSDEDTQNESHADDDDDDDDDEDSDDGGGGPAGTSQSMEPGAMDSDTGSITSDDEESEAEAAKKTMKLDLREILFYDDKISIFKARHGRL